MSTPAVPTTNVWVPCGSGVIVYNRGPVTVEVAHNGTDFVTNTQTARAGSGAARRPVVQFRGERVGLSSPAPDHVLAAQEDRLLSRDRPAWSPG